MIWQTDIGTFTLYAIEDGWSMRDPTVFFEESDPEVWAANPQFLDNGILRVAFGCFLLRTGDGLVLIDTGMGTPEDLPEDWGSGHLLDALRKLEIDPADITDVVHTHLHPDHMGGDVADDTPVYANARYWTHTREVEFWETDAHPAAPHVRHTVEVLRDHNRLSVIDSDQQVAKGVTMLETFGHTPGHTSVIVASGGERAYVTGDVTHHPLQAIHSDWNLQFDEDKAQSEITRRRVFDQLADSGVMLAAGHYPRPGLGRIVTDEGFRVFTPAPARLIG